MLINGRPPAASSLGVPENFFDLVVYVVVTCEHEEKVAQSVEVLQYHRVNIRLVGEVEHAALRQQA